LAGVGLHGGGFRYGPIGIYCDAHAEVLPECAGSRGEQFPQAGRLSDSILTRPLLDSRAHLRILFIISRSLLYSWCTCGVGDLGGDSVLLLRLSGLGGRNPALEPQSHRLSRELRGDDNVMKTIVIADDDPASLELVFELLEAEGYSVIEASNGYDALEKIEEFLPDLLVMDIEMPLIGGLDAIKRIRQDERFAKLLVMAVTASAMEGDREEILSSGFDSYISKPVDAATFKLRVRELLEAEGHF
jgi:two-component system cell cycle response regulator DivK